MFKKWLNKQTISTLIIGFILGSTLLSFAAEEYKIKSNPYKIKVNGTEQKIEALNINDFTWIKARDVAKFFNGMITLNFNEIEESIDINTVTGNVYNPSPTPVIVPIITPIDNPTPTPVIKPQKTNEYMKDGLVAVDINDKTYLSVRPISDKHNYLIQFDYDFNTSILSARHQNGKKLLDDIPHIIISGRAYIEYNYYIDTILPLIE
jgi:hypothetical protein